MGNSPAKTPSSSKSRSRSSTTSELQVATRFDHQQNVSDQIKDSKQIVPSDKENLYQAYATAKTMMLAKQQQEEFQLQQQQLQQQQQMNVGDYYYSQQQQSEIRQSSGSTISEAKLQKYYSQNPSASLTPDDIEQIQDLAYMQAQQKHSQKTPQMSKQQQQQHSYSQQTQSQTPQTHQKQQQNFSSKYPDYTYSGMNNSEPFSPTFESVVPGSPNIVSSPMYPSFSSSTPITMSPIGSYSSYSNSETPRPNIPPPRYSVATADSHRM